MTNRPKQIVFAMLGLALGYVCHRMSLLYDQLTNLPVFERWAYLVMNGQEELIKNPVNLSGHY